MRPPAARTSEATLRNIRALCDLEREAERGRTWGERVSDSITGLAGRVWFVFLHLAWFGLWIWWNHHPPRGKAFDPYPYELLMLAVSLESIVLSLLILISQNRANQLAEERALLDLQVNLLNEREATKALRLLHSLCAAQGISCQDDPELDELSQQTEVRHLIRALRQERRRPAPWQKQPV